MIFFANSQGTTELVQSTPIYQGSSLANEITLVAPFSKYNSVTVAFKLADGTITSEKLMTSVPLSNNISFNGKQCNAWTYVVEQSITEKTGTVQVQFYVRNSNSLLASYGTQFQVQKGVAPILPTSPSQDIYTQILNYLTTVNEGIGYGIKSIEISDIGNQITNYYASVLGCTGSNVEGYVNNQIAGTDSNGYGQYPYYTDYPGGTNGSMTGNDLREGLQNISYNIQNNQVVYNPKKQFLKSNPNIEFIPYGIALTFPIPQDVGILLIYTDIFYYGQTNSDNQTLVPDRYKINVYDENAQNILYTTIVNYPSKIVPFIAVINQKNVRQIEIQAINAETENATMFSSGCLPIYGLKLTSDMKDTLSYQITTYSGNQYQLEFPVIENQLAEINSAKDEALSDIATQVNKAETSAANAKNSEDNAKASETNASNSATNAEMYYNNLISKENEIGGFPVLEDINGQPKIPSVLINQADIKEYIEITDENQLDTITAQVGDVAVLVEDNTVTKSWILLSIDNGVRNWVIFGTSYATNAGHATTADSATNALKINGVQFRVMTEEEYENSDKLGIIFVTYPNPNPNSEE